MQLVAACSQSCTASTSRRSDLRRSRGSVRCASLELPRPTVPCVPKEWERCCSTVTRRSSAKKEKRPEQDLNLRRQSLIDGELIRVYPLNRSGIWPLVCSVGFVYKYKARCLSPGDISARLARAPLCRRPLTSVHRLCRTRKGEEAFSPAAWRWQNGCRQLSVDIFSVQAGAVVLGCEGRSR